MKQTRLRKLLKSLSSFLRHFRAQKLKGKGEDGQEKEEGQGKGSKASLRAKASNEDVAEKPKARLSVAEFLPPF